MIQKRGKLNYKWIDRQQNKSNKFNAKPKEFGGVRYDSTLECNYAMWLDSLVKHDKLKEVERQHKIFFSINGKHLWNHIVDFRVTLPDDRVKFVEAKGFATELWRRNFKLCEALYPDIEYLVNPTERELLR